MFYILFLSIEPGVKAMYAGISKEKVECCENCCFRKENSSSQKEKKSSDKNTTENCNPFEACNACIGYTVNISPIAITILPVFYADKHLATAQDKLFSDFASDF